MAGIETLIAGLGFFLLFVLVLSIIIIAGMWKVYTKAGQPGWASIIPIYNIYILLKIVCKPTWWLILYLIPLVNFITIIIVLNNLSAKFQKGIGFTVGLILLPFIFIPLLGFGDAEYQKC